MSIEGGGLGRAAAKLARLDAAVAKVERAAIVSLLAIMTVAVFLDAIHRTLSARPLLAPAIVGALAAAIAYAAARGGGAAERPRRPSRARALLGAAIAAALAVGAAAALVRGLPNGLVWSQQMALCFLLWVGLLGASLATRERAHIAFELAGKLWPGRSRRAADLLARIASAAFAALLALLAFRYAAESYEEWAASDGAAGLFEAFRVPRFFVYGFLPIPLAVMALRFLGHGASGALAAPAPPGEPPP